MIKFKSNNFDKAYTISNNYTPRLENFKSGTYFINGKEYTEWNAEFREAVNKEKMWIKLQK